MVQRIFFIMSLSFASFLAGETKVPTPAPVPTPVKKPIIAQPTVAQKKQAALVQKQEQELQRLADGVQKHYNSTKSATFDFEQIYKHPFLTVTETSKGSVAYSRTGGKMLWAYAEPKERQKKFFIDGKRFTYYAVSDKTAFTHNCYDKDTLSASIAFLLGTGNLKEAFTIAAFEGEVPNKLLSWLTLVPKEQNTPVKRLFLGVSKDFKVAESIVEDPSGGKNHFKFTNFKLNPIIAASVFEFKAPPDVLVQPMPNVVCPEPPPAPKPTPQAAPKKPVMKKPVQEK